MSARRAAVYIALGIWAGGLCFAFYELWKYKLTPGAQAVAPETWPRASRLSRASGKPSIVMVAHPQCACTRASMTELSRLATELHDTATIHIILVRPTDAPADFELGPIRDAARAIAGAELFIDDEGQEAARFGAVVSGSTMLYAADGTLLFRGGLTTARGHVGRGPATDVILSLVAHPKPAHAEAPTFGCAIASTP